MQIDEETQRKETIKMIACQQLTNQTFEKDNYILKEILDNYKKKNQAQIEKKIKVGMIFHCLKTLQFDILKEITKKLDDNVYQPEDYEQYLGIFQWKKYQNGNIDYHLTEEEKSIYDSQGRLKNMLGKKYSDSQYQENSQKNQQQQQKQNNPKKQKEIRYIDKPEFRFEAPWLVYLIFGFSLSMFIGLSIYFTYVKFTSKKDDNDSDSSSEDQDDGDSSESEEEPKKLENKKND